MNSKTDYQHPDYSPSDAQIIFKDKKLLIERPENMEYNEYKVLQRIQREVMKRLFHKGKAPSRKIAQQMPPSRLGNLLPSVSLTDYLRYLTPKPKDGEA